MDDSNKTRQAEELPSVARRGRGRPKSQPDPQRRAAIIDTARRTFIELGLAGTTTEIVASRCHISKQTLYRLFPSKTDLFVAVVAAHRQTMLDLPRPPEEDAPLAEIIGRIFMLDIDAETEREREAFIRMVMQQSHQMPELMEVLFREGPETSRRQLADWLSGQMTRGRLVLEDPVTGARILMDLLMGGIGRGPKGWKDLADRRRHMEQAIALFVRGTRPA
ncbi:transcriptional regulator, TetR family [Rhizobium sp. RU35A]|uniref:TetR/AcrR family transcriptional regulator n=1 Tax=Rhizobium sp. RU35A TaxID=1907414 RepID=UPI00095530B0|nr:TetR/AcrR family transcriptional regulator [Rhizobium sp. RU35A]SIQ10719.1 transcriptional regulator, TetR family [Rhizobium sp. RU35A]